MSNIIVECFRCRKDVKTELTWREKGKQNVQCACGAEYKVTSFKSGKANIMRTDI